jgi:hypothetical protein
LSIGVDGAKEGASSLKTRVDVFYMPEESNEAPKDDIGILLSTEKLDTYRL